MSQSKIQQICQRASQVNATALGFSIPVSVALDNLLIAFFPLLWLAGGDLKGKWATMCANPVGRALLFLSGLVLIGCFYGPAPLSEIVHYGGKYKELLFAAMLLPVFRDPKRRQKGLQAFFYAMLATLLISYGEWVWIHLAPNHTAHLFHYNGVPYPVPFKSHITQSIFMSFFAFWLAIRARQSEVPADRLVLNLLALLAVVNVLVMVPARTGYITLGAVILYYFALRYRTKGVIIGVVTLAALAAGLYVASPSFHARVAAAVHEEQRWQPDHASHSSNGLRLEFWTNSMRIIRAHPLVGVGTGGFATAYQAQKLPREEAASNPHNQFILLTAQLGGIGLLAFLYLIYTQWRVAVHLPTTFDCQLARGMLLTFLSGNVVNSLLLDHAEGFFYMYMTAVLFAALPLLGSTKHC